MGQFVAGLKVTANALKIEQANQIRWEKERAERRKCEEELRRRHQEYSRKAAATVHFARGWQESRLLGDFAAACEAEIKTLNLNGDQQQEAVAMLEWVKQHAANVDPLSNVPWMLEEFKRAIDLYGFPRW